MSKNIVKNIQEYVADKVVQHISKEHTIIKDLEHKNVLNKKIIKSMEEATGFSVAFCENKCQAFEVYRGFPDYMLCCDSCNYNCCEQCISDSGWKMSNFGNYFCSNCCENIEIHLNEINQHLNEINQS